MTRDVGTADLLRSRDGIVGKYFAAAFFDSAAAALWLATLTWVASGADSQVVAGIIMFAGVVPGILAAGLVGGRLIDDQGADHVVSLTMASRAVLMLCWVGLVAWMTDEPSLLVGAAVIAFLFDGLTGLHAPAVSTYTIDLVPPDQQVVARSTSTVVLRVAQLLGMGIGAVLVARVDLAIPATAAFVCLVMSWLLYNAVRRLLARNPSGRVTGGGASSGQPGWGELLRRALPGWRILGTDAVLLRCVVLQATVTTGIAAAVTAGLPLRIRNSDLPSITFGWGMSMYLFGLLAGSMAGMFVAKRLQQPVRLGISAGLVTGLGLILIGLFHGQLILIGSLAIVGTATGLIGPMLSGYRAERLSLLSADLGESVAGRAEAAVTVLQLIEPIGYPLMGVLGALVGAAPASGLIGVVVVAAALFGISSPAVRTAGRAARGRMGQ